MGPKRLITCLALGAALAGCGSNSSTSSSTSSTGPGGATSTSGTSTQRAAAVPASGPVGPEGIRLEQGPDLAPATSTLPGTPVDGIQCAPVEQLAYHIHARLQVFVNGASRVVPGGVGLIGPVSQQSPAGAFYGATRCYYWLHVHANDGIVHIESPTARIYTLGAFFDEWHQPLTGNQVGPASGKVTAFLNGQAWTGDPRSIPLASHNVIQLDVGAPVVAFQPVSFAGSGL